MSKYKSAIDADKLFPSQIDIDYHEYRLAGLRFFRIMKKLPRNERASFFFENYHSEMNLAWFILNGIRYFTILYHQGTPVEDRYYGKQNVLFNPFNN